MEQFPHIKLEHPLHGFKHNWHVDPEQEEQGWDEATMAGFKAAAVDENLTQDTQTGCPCWETWAFKIVEPNKSPCFVGFVWVCRCLIEICSTLQDDPSSASGLTRFDEFEDILLILMHFRAAPFGPNIFPGSEVALVTERNCCADEGASAITFLKIKLAHFETFIRLWHKFVITAHFAQYLNPPSLQLRQNLPMLLQLCFIIPSSFSLCGTTFFASAYEVVIGNVSSSVKKLCQRFAIHIIHCLRRPVK